MSQCYDVSSTLAIMRDLNVEMAKSRDYWQVKDEEINTINIENVF